MTALVIGFVALFVLSGIGNGSGQDDPAIFEGDPGRWTDWTPTRGRMVATT